MGSTNLMQKSAELAMSVTGGSKPVFAQPSKSAALPTTHWTQRNSSTAQAHPFSRTANSLRSSSVGASQGRGSHQPAAASTASLSLTASHMSPIKQSLKSYQSELVRAKPETNKDVVEEMQKKAKARADSWKRQLLADANSVREFPPAQHFCRN
jgi:hypothetical protein